MSPSRPVDTHVCPAIYPQLREVREEMVSYLSQGYYHTGECKEIKSDS